MKSFIKKTLISFCSLALALTPFFHFEGCSLLCFGEPKYPGQD